MSITPRPKFNKGDKVFAKVRGYPPWPARVEGLADETPNKMKYHVYFYGTGETAVVKNEDICSFVDNKVRLGKPKKPKNFTEALLQIEADLSAGEKQKLTDLEAEGVDQSPNVSMNDSMPEDINKRASLPKQKASISPTLLKQKEKKRKLEESNSDDNEKKKSLPAPSNTETDPTTAKVPEVLSRSGRKIKPKRFADYENDSGEETPPVAKPVSKVAPRINPDFDSEKSATAGDSVIHIIAYVNNEKIKIPLDIGKPDNLDPEAEVAWNTSVSEYATVLKTRLEAGEMIPESVEESMQKWSRDHALRFDMITTKHLADADTKKFNHIKTEGRMLEIDLGIRSALNIKNPDPSKCITLLNELIELKLTPIMLKKHPDIVETIKKVRKYIGNVPSAYSETEETDFHRDTAVIRKKAEFMYGKFQSLFQVPSHKSFWDYFEHEKDYFYHQTKNLSTQDIINLVEEIV